MNGDRQDERADAPDVQTPSPNLLVARQLAADSSRRNGGKEALAPADTILDPPGPPSEPPSGLASPRAVMLLIPLLVLLVGAALLWIGQSALGANSHSMARQRLHLQTDSSSQRIAGALSQADVVLDRLEQLARTEEVHGHPESPAELLPVALELRDLILGRPGVTQAYLAFPDGRFLSTDPTTEEDGAEWTFQVTDRGLSHVFSFDGLSLKPRQTMPSRYDPRTRSWYELARSQGDRAWSAPYPFWFNGKPGVTRVLPVYERQGSQRLVAVAGVDFDVDALTRFMAQAETEDAHSVVFTASGVVLAYPAGSKAMRQLDVQRQGVDRSDRQVPSYEELDDPMLDGLFAQLGNAAPSTERASSVRYVRYQAGGENVLASVRPLEAHLPNWYVATLSPQSGILSSLREYRLRSLSVAAIALSLAVLVAWVFARHIVQVREEVKKARAAATEAHQKARDLGSYRLVERIGEGGMGEVWRARHRLLAREAAVKLIRVGLFEGLKQEEMEERFRREAQAIAGLRSRNTIELFDYGITAEGTLFYAMELLEGIDLQTLVEKHGPQPGERVRQVLLQACNSLGEAHAAHLVHRDVKPANLFLCRAADEVDVLKVLDFGLVFSPLIDDVESVVPTNPEELSQEQMEHAASRLTQGEIQLGTPGFMSPEQALGTATDGRSDVYALACVAWWLLTGKPPYEGRSPLRTMLMHIQSPVPDIQTALGHPLHEDFARIVTACLQKNPEDRPQSARELARSLKALGPVDDQWSEAIAQKWWDEHLPADPRPASPLSIPPPRTVQLVPPRPQDV